jgi:hypothetical protein
MSTPTPVQSSQAASTLAFLRDPLKSLPALGQVHDQQTGQFIKYDPFRLTGLLQYQILEYFSNPPRTDDGQTRFLTILTARQMGKSLVAEYGCYPKAAYNPGWDHVCIADIGDRADYLHRRVHHLHERWPTQLRAPTIPNREARQLTFERKVGGKMRVLSAETGAVGIGQSPDSFHASECAFWADFAGSMVLINPSLANRDNALAVFECTPWRADGDWYDHVLEAKRGMARHAYLFQPFWDGRLNYRRWNDSWSKDLEELRLMEKYGPLGLVWENLAFRRFIMETDVEIRRHPELFGVFYPFDDVTCWTVNATSAIPGHALERHQWTATRETAGPYTELHVPRPEAKYVIGADPCGHAARDHAAFQCLEINEDAWYQVSHYAAHTDPVAFTNQLIKTGLRYNKALIVVERNGVGEAVLSLLRDRGYPNIFYQAPGKPGVATSGTGEYSVDKLTSWLIDGLMDELVLEDKDTVSQLCSYKNDKRIEEGAVSELVRGAPSKRRRDRHHWDKVSALMMAIIGARRTPRSGKRKQEFPAGDNPIHSGLYKASDRKAQWAQMQRGQQKKGNHWHGK